MTDEDRLPISDDIRMVQAKTHDIHRGLATDLAALTDKIHGQRGMKLTEPLTQNLDVLIQHRARMASIMLNSNPDSDDYKTATRARDYIESVIKDLLIMST